MIILNQFKSNPNHLETIKKFLSHSSEARVMLTFIKNSGTELLYNSFKKCIKNGGAIKILFGGNIASDPDSLQKLLDLGIEIKIFFSDLRFFHPKTWLFINHGYNLLIGSANLSKSALLSSVEVSYSYKGSKTDSIISNYELNFDELWNDKSSLIVDKAFIKTYIENKKNTDDIKYSITRKASKGHSYDIVKKFIFDWINLEKKDRSKVESLWRGWYLFPDQGPIDISMMDRIKKMLKFISKLPEYKKNGYWNISTSKSTLSDEMNNLFRFSNKTFVRPIPIKNYRYLFIRQELNYMRKMRLLTMDEHTKNIFITSEGKRFSSYNLAEQKKFFKEFLMQYNWFSVKPLPFLSKLLIHLESPIIDFFEFAFIVAHAKANNEFYMIYSLINMYRGLEENQKLQLQQKVFSHFQKIKGTTGKGVLMNYNKKMAFWLFSLSFIEGIEIINPGLKYTNLKIKVTNEFKLKKIVEYSDIDLEV